MLGQPVLGQAFRAMRKLFEPLRGDVRDIRQGLGLGLHIASQIAQVCFGME